MAARSRPALVTVGALLATTACRARGAHAGAWTHGLHCDGRSCALDDVSWLLGWIAYARRASLVLIMLSGIVLYYIPETRAPARKGCHFAIDLLASGLKTMIGKIDGAEEIKEDKDRGDFTMSRSFMIDNANFLPLHFTEEPDKECALLERNVRRNVSFNVPESEILRQQRKKQRNLKRKNENGNQAYRQLYVNIHQPSEMKFKEKSSVEKVSVCPLPLMQFDTSERQNLNTSFPLSNDNCNPCLTRLDEKVINIKKPKEKVTFSDSYSQYQREHKVFEKSLGSKKHNPRNGNFNQKLWSVSEVELSDWTESEYNKAIQDLDNNENFYTRETDCQTESKSHFNYQTHDKLDRPAPIIYPVSTNLRNRNFNNRHNNSKLVQPKTCSISHVTKMHNKNNKNCINKFEEISFCNEKELITGNTESASSYPTERRNQINKNCFNESKEASFYNDGKLKTEITKSSLSRALEWIFGGCPNKRNLQNFYDKKITAIVQDKLPEYFK